MEEPAASSPSAYLPSLTAVRFFAALVVVMHHLVSRFPQEAARHLSRWFLGADQAVTLFFVLSGAIITMSWPRGERAPTFWRKRAARILPLYLLFGVANAAWLIYRSGSVDPVDVVLYVTMTQAWTTRAFALQGPAWSLSCEAFFYLVYPALRPVLLLLATVWTRLAAVAVLLALKWQLLPFHPFGPHIRFVDFAVGAVVGLHLRSEAGRSVPPLVGTAVLAAAYATVVVPSLHGMASVAPTLFLAAAAFCILVLARADQGGRTTGIRWAAPLGVRSYALFISHYLVIRMGLALFGRLGWSDGSSDLAMWTQITVLLAACFAVAELSYRVIERPAEQRLRGAPPRVELRAATA